MSFPIVPLKDAAAQLGIKPQTLRAACEFIHGRDADRQQALAIRLGAQKIGRDWYVAAPALEAEVARRKAAG